MADGLNEMPPTNRAGPSFVALLSDGWEDMLLLKRFRDEVTSSRDARLQIIELRLKLREQCSSLLESFEAEVEVRYTQRQMARLQKDLENQ